MLGSTGRLPEMTRPVDKKGSLLLGKGERDNLYKTCPQVLKENFYDLQKRKYGKVVSKDITGWIIGNLVIEGLYQFTYESMIPKNEIDRSLWVARCTCGAYELFRYSTLKNFTRISEKVTCNHCRRGWAITGA